VRPDELFSNRPVMKRYLIDHQGKVWTFPGTGLGETLGYPDPDFDVWAYAIRNLGAVEIACEEDAIVVTMRTATARAEAVRAAENFLETLDWQPVRLRYEIGSWIEETCENPQQAVGRMASALADAARESRRVAFAAKARKLDALSERRINRIETAEDRFSLMFKKWRMTSGTFDADTASFLVRFGMIDRTLVVAESPDDGEFTFDHVGVEFRAYDSAHKRNPFWAFELQGRRFADQPDADYGRWLDRTYRNVLEKHEPRFDYVDAVIQASGAEPYRSRYDRLVLPWKSPFGKRVITSISYQTKQPDHAVQQ
jgi:hypothetical protein